MAEAVTKKEGTSALTKQSSSQRIKGYNSNKVLPGDWSLKMIGNSQELEYYIRKKNPNLEV